MIRTFLAVGCFAISFTWQNFASAAVITGVTIEEVSSELTNGPFRRFAVHTIDGGGGVPVSSYTGGHGNTPEDAMWLSDGAGTHSAGNVPDPHIAAGDGLLGHIVFDLGAVYDVSQFHVWNYNEGANSTTLARGANAVTVLVSESNTLTGLAATGPGISTLAGPTALTSASGASGDAGTNYSAAFRARYVRFDISSNHGGDDRFVGLSEIRFDGTPVPEPSALLLAGLAALGLAGVAWRRK